MNPFLNFKEDMWIKMHPLDDIETRKQNIKLIEVWAQLQMVKDMLKNENSHCRYYDIIFWRPKNKLVIFRKLWKEYDDIVEQYCGIYNELKKDQ